MNRVSIAGALALGLLAAPAAATEPGDAPSAPVLLAKKDKRKHPTTNPPPATAPAPVEPITATPSSPPEVAPATATPPTATTTAQVVAPPPPPPPPVVIAPPPVVRAPPPPPPALKAPPAAGPPPPAPPARQPSWVLPQEPPAKPKPLPPGKKPPPPPPPPPPVYTPPWLMQLKHSSFNWQWGHIGYELKDVKGAWTAGENAVVDRGLYLGLGADDRFLFIANVEMVARFSVVHDGTTPRGESFSIERMHIFLHGNLMTPRLFWMMNYSYLTVLGSSPFLLDVMFGAVLVPNRLIVLAGQFPMDVVPQCTTAMANYQLGDRSIMTTFFFYDRSQGARLQWNPVFKPGKAVLSLQAGVFNHNIIEGGALAYNAFNQDLDMMYMGGFDLTLGPPYGVREGDFLKIPKFRARLTLKALYADVDTSRTPGTVALRGRAEVVHGQFAFKYSGLSFLLAGAFRNQSFLDLNPDQMDFGLNLQVGYFIIPHMLEISGRYSEIFPDLLRKSGPPRDIAVPSLLQPKFDVYDPFIPRATMEAGGGLRFFPFKDQQFALLGVYLWRNVDSVFFLQAAMFL